MTARARESVSYSVVMVGRLVVYHIVVHFPLLVFISRYIYRYESVFFHAQRAICMHAVRQDMLVVVQCACHRQWTVTKQIA